MKVPSTLHGRAARSLEEFVALFFAAGPKRNAARRLWRALEAEFQVDLAQLDPDDTMRTIVGDVDSLAFIQFVVVLEELGQPAHGGSVKDPDRTFAECTFRELVDLIA